MLATGIVANMNDLTNITAARMHSKDAISHAIGHMAYTIIACPGCVGVYVCVYIVTRGQYYILQGIHNINITEHRLCRCVCVCVYSNSRGDNVTFYRACTISI